MNVIVDVIGSTVIGSYILLMVFGLNFQINDAVMEKLEHTVIQQKIIAPNLVMDFDLYKVGYRVTGTAIRSAGATGVTFLSDLDNNGVVDSVRYFITVPETYGKTTLPLNGAEKSRRYPEPVMLYRRFNTNPPTLMGYVSKFELTYYDKAGVEIPASLLSAGAGLSTIKSLRVHTVFESPNQINQAGAYNPATVVKRVISPKNV